MATLTTNGEHPANSWTPPPLPPGYTKHHIVYLESVHLKLREFEFPHTFDVYEKTANDEIVERIKPATIVLTNVCEVMPEHVEQAPNLQMLFILATGIGWVDKEYFARKGITVMNNPGANIDAVSEHFLTLYFASRKRVHLLDHVIKTSHAWEESLSLAGSVWPQGPPLGCKQETLSIIGYGALGHAIEELAHALSFKEVLIAERKRAAKVRPGRVTFEEALERGTTIVVVCPRDADTINMIDEPELKTLRKNALLINIGRGGIINEGALAKALKESWIFGAATDVLEIEPNGPGGTPLLPDLSKGEDRVPNLLVTAHTAWFSQTTMENILNRARDTPRAFAEGKIFEPPINERIVVHQGKVWK